MSQAVTASGPAGRLDRLVMRVVIRPRVVAGAVGSVAVLWRGLPAVAAADTREYDRLGPIFEALSEAGVAVVPVVYSDQLQEEALGRLRHVEGVLVWVDPIGPDADRTVLDAVLREASARGVWVSAHPDTIDKMGTKEVLYRTRSLGWGVDTRLYLSASEFREQFPASLAVGVQVIHRVSGAAFTYSTASTFT